MYHSMTPLSLLSINKITCIFGISHIAKVQQKVFTKSEKCCIYIVGVNYVIYDRTLGVV